LVGVLSALCEEKGQMATTTKTTARSGNRTPHQAGKAASQSRRWTRVAQGTAAEHPPLHAGWRAHGVWCMREAAETPLAQQRGSPEKSQREKCKCARGATRWGGGGRACDTGTSSFNVGRGEGTTARAPTTHGGRGPARGSHGAFLQSRGESVVSTWALRERRAVATLAQTDVGGWVGGRGHAAHATADAAHRVEGGGPGGRVGGGSVGGLTWSGCALRLTHTTAKPQRCCKNRLSSFFWKKENPFS
jgi:hypothetical protein